MFNIRRETPVYTHTHTLPPDTVQNSVGINNLMISVKIWITTYFATPKA